MIDMKYFPFFIFIGLWIFLALSPVTSAQPNSEALRSAVLRLSENGLEAQKGKKIYLKVVNRHSQLSDTVAKEIQSELRQQLNATIPDADLVVIEESLSGIGLNDAIQVKGEYEQTGENIKLVLTALSGTGGKLISTSEVEYHQNVQGKGLTAVLDIEASGLKPNQKKAYSEVFKAALTATGAFQLANSADVDRMNPDAIQKVNQCSRDECATIVGEQLGVDEVISTQVLKISDSNFLLSSKIIRIQNGTIRRQSTMRHFGGLDKLDRPLQELAEALSKKEMHANKRNANSSAFTVAGIEFVKVEGACFSMGDIFHPTHEVCVDTFWISNTEVTIGVWAKVMQDTEIQKILVEYPAAVNRPIVNIGRAEINRFIGKLNQQSATALSLPTEAEWEYACREGGKLVKYGTGHNKIGFQDANFDPEADMGALPNTSTKPVSSFEPNALGLFDMSGNVSEWVLDKYAYPYQPEKKVNPSGPDHGRGWVRKGGAYIDDRSGLKCSSRTVVYPEGNHVTGFRLVGHPQGQ